MNNILTIKGLTTSFASDGRKDRAVAVNGVDLVIPAGRTVGLVGESGCGKSVTALSVMGLLAENGRVDSGEAIYAGRSHPNGVDLLRLSDEEMRKIRGNRISMIFQEPMTSLNPVFRIGFQLDEVIALHNPQMTKEEVKARSIDAIKMVGIADAEGVYNRYPHELSGGMRQRIVIAMALVCNPRLIIADEPTTALDVTIQAQILELLRELKDKINASIMLITHDLGVIAEMADYVVVMYAGRVVEKGLASEVFLDPRHPYTIGLMESKPVINKKVDRLYSIPGAVPNPINMPDYCYFRDRCEKCVARCEGKYPHEMHITDTHIVSCWRYFDEDKGGAQNG